MLPEITINSAPAAGESGIGPDVVFEWSVMDSDNDDVVVFLNLSGENPPSDQIYSGQAESYSVSGLDYGETYYWYISAFDGKDTSVTAVKSFTVRGMTWQETAEKVEPSVYIIGLLKDAAIMGVGTGFAIDEKTIMTNAHVVEGLREYLTEWGDTTLTPIAVRTGGSLFGEGFYRLDSFAVHPGYDTGTSETKDFGLVKVSGSLPSHLEFAKDSTLSGLSAGDEIASIGFPGELNFMAEQNPVATFKNGTISALRAFGGVVPSPENSFYVQHNLDLSGGTSGSPIFTKGGKVVAVNNSGIEVLVYSAATGDWERVPQSSLGFGIRADLREGLFDAALECFADLEPVIVTYTFINGSWTDLEMRVDGSVVDTIDWHDTLSLWDYAKTPVMNPISFETIVATENSLWWYDTIYTGMDFSRKYYVSDAWFLLGVKNNTNKDMRSCVVSNFAVYDSSGVYIPQGYYRDVGYYNSATYTDIRMYFYDATQYLNYDDMNTRSDDVEAEFKYLTPGSVLPKSLGAAGGGKVKVDGEKRVLRYTDFMNNTEN